HPFLAQTYGHACLCSFLHTFFCRDTWKVEILLRHVIGVEPAHRICTHSFCCLIENDHVPFGFVHRRTIFRHQRSITEERLKWRLVLQDSAHHQHRIEPVAELPWKRLSDKICWEPLFPVIWV